MPERGARCLARASAPPPPPLAIPPSPPLPGGCAPEVHMVGVH